MGELSGQEFRPEASTLHGILREAAERYRDRTALIHGDLRLTFRELLEMTERFSCFLVGLGIEKGDSVALYLANSPQFVIAHYALASLGAIVVPVNVHVGGSTLQYILDKSDAVAVVTSPSAVPQIQALERMPSRLRAILVASGGETGPASWQVGLAPLAGGIGEPTGQPLANFARPPQTSTVDPDDDAIIFFTSGTTGRPKGILVTHRQALIGLDCWADRWGFGPETISLMVAPFFHVVYNPLVLGAHRHGGCAVVLDRLSVRAACREVERSSVTAIMGNPSVFIQLLNDPRSLEHDLGSLDTLIYGAAPTPVPVIRSLREKFPRARMYNCYGLSETCSAVSCLGPEDTDTRPDSIGRPHPTMQVTIVSEDGDPIAVGKIGEICCRGSNVMKGYYKAPEETRARYVRGWLKTGDLGYLDDSGYLYILDRVDDLIIISGEKIYPSEVERALGEHPAVAEAAVVGHRHPTKGHLVKAYVVPRAGAALTEGDLRRFCAERMSPVCVPKVLEIVTSLPRNPSGKVLRSALV